MDRHDTALVAEMPERPAVARWSALQLRTDLVDRAPIGIRDEVAISRNFRRDFFPRIRQHCAGLEQSLLNQRAEGDARLLPFRRRVEDLACADIFDRLDALGCDIAVGFFALNPDIVAAKFFRYRASGAGAEEGIDDEVAWGGRRHDDAIEQGFGLLC